MDLQKYINSMDVSNRDQRYINMAFEASHLSNMTNKHGCVVVSHNRILASGYNSYRNQFKDDFIGDACSCHAEMHALRQAVRHIKKRSPRKKIPVVLRSAKVA